MAPLPVLREARDCRRRSLHFSWRTLGCRVCKGKERFGTDVQQLKRCPELSAKIAAGITAPAKTGKLRGAGQAGVFREELEEEEYFWWAVLPPSF